MDRRTFLTGIGATGTIGAIAAAVAVRESNIVGARVNGLAQAAGASNSPRRTSSQADQAIRHGLTVGYLPGSSGMFSSRAVEAQMSANAAHFSWSVWG